MNSKTIMVTGGAGLIGREVCKQLAGKGHTVHLFDLGEQIARVEDSLPKENIKLFYGSVLDSTSLRSAMRHCDIVIHLAALLGVNRSEKEKLHCIEINIEGTKKVLDCIVHQGVEKIVFASSSEVYGEPIENPITEESITQGKTVYAVTKLAGEELCKAYAQIYPVNYTILRYFNCYGPYQVAQFVIMKFINNVMNNKPPVIYGSGKQVRSYTYVSDTAGATVMAALSTKANNDLFNVGNGDEPISIVKLANLVIEIGAKKGKLKPEYRRNFKDCDRKQEREIYERFCTAKKVRKVLGWKPKVSLVSGIKKVFDSGVMFDKWANLYDEGP